MSFYGDLAATATRLLTVYGLPTTLNRYTPTANGITGTVTQVVGSTSSVVSVRVPLSSYADVTTLTETLAGKTGAAFIVSATTLTFELRAHDELSVGGVAWDILEFTPIVPAGVALAYKVLAVLK